VIEVQDALDDVLFLLLRSLDVFSQRVIYAVGVGENLPITHDIVGVLTALLLVCGSENILVLSERQINQTFANLISLLY